MRSLEITSDEEIGEKAGDIEQKKPDAYLSKSLMDDERLLNDAQFA